MSKANDWEDDYSELHNWVVAQVEWVRPREVRTEKTGAIIAKDHLAKMERSYVVDDMVNTVESLRAMGAL